MAIDRRYDGAGRSRGRGRLMKVTSLALGIAMFGTVGMSGTLAQDDPGAGTTDAESMVENIIAEIFGELDDDAAVSGGDLNIGGSSGSTVTMGGSGGSVTMGGGVTVGDNYGG
jgi:hypothetical protein